MVGFVGDGATSEPDFHNALNFAGVHKVPCVMICQNNHFAISVRPWQQTASESYAAKGVAYGVRSLQVDGNDVLAMYHAVRYAADLARAGQGPTFIEAVTYRVGAHSTSDDPRLYRSDEEVEAWRKRDPVAALRRHLEHDVPHRAEAERRRRGQRIAGQIGSRLADRHLVVERIHVLATLCVGEPIVGHDVEDVSRFVPGHLHCIRGKQL